MNQDLIGSEHRDTFIKWDGGNDTLKFFIRKQKELGGRGITTTKKLLTNTTQMGLEHKNLII